MRARAAGIYVIPPDGGGEWKLDEEGGGRGRGQPPLSVSLARRQLVLWFSSAAVRLMVPQFVVWKSIYTALACDSFVTGESVRLTECPYY